MQEAVLHLSLRFHHTIYVLALLTDMQLGLWLIDGLSWGRHSSFFSRFLNETKLELAMENSGASQGQQGQNPPGTCVIRISYGKFDTERSKQNAR